jgi:hypothetical protein
MHVGCASLSGKLDSETIVSIDFLALKYRCCFTTRLSLPLELEREGIRITMEHWVLAALSVKSVEDYMSVLELRRRLRLSQA